MRITIRRKRRSRDDEAGDIRRSLEGRDEDHQRAVRKLDIILALETVPGADAGVYLDGRALHQADVVVRRDARLARGVQSVDGKQAGSVRLVTDSFPSNGLSGKSGRSMPSQATAAKAKVTRRARYGFILLQVLIH